MAELDDSVRECIAKHLPEQVGSVLRARLDQTDKLAKRVQDLEKQVLDREELLKKHSDLDSHALQVKNEEAARMKSVREAEAAIAKREKDILAREAGVAMLEMKANLAERHCHDFKELFAGMFRHPKIVTSVYETATKPIGIQGGYQATQQETKQTTTTTETTP